jgi:WD40 repeat protein
VHPLAQRLLDDGLRVWLDAFEILPGDSIPIKIEEGLEDSRVLVLVMSANAFGSDWSQLEANTFRFRDPINRDRRFIPLRLDQEPIPGSLAQFSYIKWTPEHRESEYPKLLASCKLQVTSTKRKTWISYEQFAERTLYLDTPQVQDYAFSAGGNRVLTAQWTSKEDHAVALWDLEEARCLHLFKGHTEKIRRVKWSADEIYALSAANDGTMRLWDVSSGSCIRVSEKQGDFVDNIAFGPGENKIIAMAGLYGNDRWRLIIWDLKSGACKNIDAGIDLRSFALSPDQRRGLAGGSGIIVWDTADGHRLSELRSDDISVHQLAWHPDGRRAISVADGFRIWEVQTGRLIRKFGDHLRYQSFLTWCPNGRHLLWGQGKTIQLWNSDTGECVALLQGHAADVENGRWSADKCHFFSGDKQGGIHVWDLSFLGDT